MTETLATLAKSVQGAVSYHAGRAAELQVAQDYRRRGFALAHERWRGKAGRIYRSAEEFIGGEPKGALTDVRFDVALVDQTGDLRILENAFGHD